MILVFGLYAIYYGHSEISKQLATIEAVSTLEKDEFSQYKASFLEELKSGDQAQTHDIASRPAYAWYRHGYHAILPPHDYSRLSIGQRDLFRFYYRLTGMSLHYQLFENELANPVNLLAGNLDLSFVIVYLLPLFIIALCYGLFSEEKERGTLSLLRIQSVSIHEIIIVRLSFYFAIVVSLALLISVIGLLTSGSPLDEENRLPAIAWLVGVVSYCAFWFGLMFLIISFRQISSFNALTAVGFWLFLLIVAPAVLNVVVTIKYPLSSATLAGITRRTGLENEDNEEESREVIKEFLAHRPALAGSDSLISHNLMPKAYAAFTTLKDINNQEEVDRYNAQVAKRNKWTARFHWLSPAVNMQEVLAHIGETDLTTFLRFQEALVGFHGEITKFYFTRLFWDKPIVLEDYDNLPRFNMTGSMSRWNTIWLGLSKIFAAALLTFSIGFFRMKSHAGQR